MKHLLVVTEVFYPENGLINDFVTELVNRGYKVDVLTQHPSYPYGYVFSGYKNTAYTIEEWKGISIHRFKVIEGYSKSKFKKIRNYLKFIYAGSRIARRIGKIYDAILVYQTGPLTVALPGIAAKKKFGIPLIIWTFDLWPDAVYAYGIPKIALVRWWLNRLIHKIYSSADQILVSSQMFAPIIKTYVPEKSIDYAPNWLTPQDEQPSEIQLNPDLFHFVFTGNISLAQNLERVVEGWQKSNLASQNAILNIVGDGSRLEVVQKVVEHKAIQGIVFHGRKPANQIADLLTQADVLLLPLIGDPGISKTEPFKLQSYLQAGKPILGVIDGAGRELIEQYMLGICASPHSIDDIAQKFNQAIPFTTEYGSEVRQRAKKLMQTRFNRETIIEQVIFIIESSTSQNRFQSEIN